MENVNIQQKITISPVSLFTNEAFMESPNLYISKLYKADKKDSNLASWKATKTKQIYGYINCKSNWWYKLLITCRKLKEKKLEYISRSVGKYETI